MRFGLGELKIPVKTLQKTYLEVLGRLHSFLRYILCNHIRYCVLPLNTAYYNVPVLFCKPTGHKENKKFKIIVAYRKRQATNKNSH